MKPSAPRPGTIREFLKNVLALSLLLVILAGASCLQILISALTTPF